MRQIKIIIMTIIIGGTIIGTMVWGYKYYQAQRAKDYLKKRVEEKQWKLLRKETSTEPKKIKQIIAKKTGDIHGAERVKFASAVNNIRKNSPLVSCEILTTKALGLHEQLVKSSKDISRKRDLYSTISKAVEYCKKAQEEHDVTFSYRTLYIAGFVGDAQLMSGKSPEWKVNSSQLEKMVAKLYVKNLKDRIKKERRKLQKISDESQTESNGWLKKQIEDWEKEVKFLSEKYNFSQNNS